MNPVSFNIMDLLELAVILGMLITAYWKLSTRQALIEQRITTLELTSENNENKLERRLDIIDDKLDSMMLELTRLKTKAGD